MSTTPTNFKGEWLTSANSNFEFTATSTIWNQLQPTDRRPDIIARVTNDQDVIIAVNYARENNLKVTIRGGGHNWVSPSLRRGGLLIDLTNLTKVISIDTENRKAIIEPIISNRDLQAAVNERGLSYPTGHCPTVKASGYMLSGGMAWNHGVWGPGCGSIDAIDMVLASGELVMASATENPDLFWAARGAGPAFFGVALRYHLRLYPTPRQIVASSYIFPLDQVVEVAKWLGPIADELTPNVELSLFMIVHPTHGKVCMITASTFADSQAEAEAAGMPLESCPLMDRCLERTFAAPVKFPDLFDMSGGLWPDGLRSSVDAMFSDKPLEELAVVSQDIFARVPSDKTVLMFAVFTGGHAPKTPEDAMFSMTGKLYGGPWTMWENADEDQANLDWHDDCINALSPFIHGHYISESNTVKHPEYVETSYLGDSLSKLESLRKVYDPQGLFFGFHDGL